jgi:adenine-specific DNA-methyltransferase
VVKYIGSKRVLVPRIVETILETWHAQSRAATRPPRVLDLFSGTSRVGHALKRAGCAVVANDHNAYALALARCYVQTDRTDRLVGHASRLIADLNKLAAFLPDQPADAPPTGGYFHDTFCLQSRFFHPSNGRRIDACRDQIAEWAKSGQIDAPTESVLLVSLMEAADRVDSTTGLQMAYLKKWAPRAFKPLSLRLPDLVGRPRSGPCTALGLDAHEALTTPEAAACDVAYLDPPYNQHSYLSNYHVWESLVRWDKPEVYGAACKRIDCRSRKSPFNTRTGALDAMTRLIDAITAPVLVISFNDEGFISRPQMEALLARRGPVEVVASDFKRYVGAQIGIHNPQGVKVGTVGRLRNTEYLFIAAAQPRAKRPVRVAATA